MQITVRYFAAHRDITGASVERVALDAPATLADLWDLLAARYPALAPFRGTLLMAINQEFATAEQPLGDGDEVAFIPPVSGGTQRFQIVETPLDAAALTATVAGPDYGAIVTFSGVVRNNFGGRETARLDYQAYAAMAERVLSQIADEARERFATGPIAIHHRVGTLEIGEVAVLVVVASAHRHAAFAAAEWTMDRIKERAPIWKKELWADGASEWVGDEQRHT